MTRKDFILIAATIRDLKGITEDQRMDIAKSFADSLATTNSAFKRSTFLIACFYDRNELSTIEAGNC